jgi:hypothetical protein
VSGAVALLFERDPTLTQPELRSLLQASAADVDVGTAQQSGAGALDLTRALDALTVSESGERREPSEGRIVLGSAIARPDADWPLRGLVQLRDASGRIADNFDQGKLRIHASPAVLKEGLTRAGPGLYRFALAAPSGTGGDTLRVTIAYGGSAVASTTVPIAVDINVARHGESARGGCSVTRRAAAPKHATMSGWMLAVGIFVWTMRRAKSRKARAYPRPATPARVNGSAAPARAGNVVLAHTSTR